MSNYTGGVQEITIEYKKVWFDVTFYHTPHEDGETGTNAQHDGTQEEIEIHEIKHKGVCFFDVLESQLEDVGNEILKTK